MAENKINNLRSPNAGFARTDWAGMVPPGCQPAGPGALSVWVAGRPAPQGSKRHVGRGVMIESSKAVKPWREDIRQAMLIATADVCPGRPPGTFVHYGMGPVVAKLVFVLPRPTATSKRRTPAATKRPDLDKLVRAVFDAIGSAGVWADDSQVVTVHAHKRLAEPGETTGVMIHIEPFDPFPDYQPRVVASASPCAVPSLPACVYGASLPSVPKKNIR